MTVLCEHWGLAVVHRTPVRERSLSPCSVVGGEVHLDIYDDRIVLTSPGGMYNGLMVQDLNLDEISSERRNPVLADVMAQLDFMEKRGSGLRRIIDETQSLDCYREDRHPLFKSNASQFMTTLYSMDYDAAEGSKLAVSWHQVGIKSRQGGTVNEEDG